MPEVLVPERVGNVGKPRPKFVHGKLMPIEAEYYKWAEKNDLKEKIEGTGGKVSYAEWLKLPDGGKGQKWFFGVDQRIFHPEWENITTRGAMVDFKEWQSIVQPGIYDAVGTVENANKTFIARAAAGDWLVEAELVFTGWYNDKEQNVFRFTRMTQDQNELRAWYNERFPKGEVKVPEELVTQAKQYNTRFARGDETKLKKFFLENEEFTPFVDELMQLAPSWA